MHILQMFACQNLHVVKGLQLTWCSWPWILQIQKVFLNLILALLVITVRVLNFSPFLTGIMQVFVQVNADNEHAHDLYKKMGFKVAIAYFLP